MKPFIDMTQNRAPWYLLTDAEKDALGVEEGQGARVEVWNDVSWTWVPKRYSGTINKAIYRIVAGPAVPEADTLRAEVARLTASYRKACEQRDTLQADVWRLREAVEIADARFAAHGMETMTARLEEYGCDHEADIHQLATYRAALAHGEADQ